MTTAVPQTTAATVKQRTCKNPDCKKRFRPTVKTAIYCSRTCKDKAANKKVKKDPLEKALKTAFFYYVARECQRAGTLEILRGHTVESLSALHTLYKSNMRYNGYGDRNEYELSHIAPVRGHDFIGLLYAENLVSAPKALNRAHGTKWFGCGKSVHRLTLDSKYNVDKRFDKESDVVARVIDYLGKDVVLATIKACKIKPAQRSQLTEWILDRYDSSNPDHVAAIPDISKVDGMNTKELQHVKATILGEETGEYFASPASRPEVVLCQELARLSAYRPELEVYAYALEEALATQTETSLFTLHHAQMLFDVLHGKSIAVMADTLEMVIAENTAHSYVTYTHGNLDGRYRYSVETFKHFDVPAYTGAKLIRTSLAAFKAIVGQRARAVVLMDTVDSLSLVRPGAMDMNSSDPFYLPPF
ncbi:hypothetical protein [Pseudomonas tussilaginis]|uniref:hypothetical protein n=1 Tax=Pseudomonas putida TaxID=303 RepID=UPI0023640F6F|nr:hypothetical protein [Pseudomonas putida]MDD1975219.1 hypothetical protein [Pseudomonas putida]